MLFHKWRQRNCSCYKSFKCPAKLVNVKASRDTPWSTCSGWNMWISWTVDILWACQGLLSCMIFFYLSNVIGCTCAISLKCRVLSFLLVLLVHCSATGRTTAFHTNCLTVAQTLETVISVCMGVWYLGEPNVAVICWAGSSTATIYCKVLKYLDVMCSIRLRSSRRT